ncbi:type IV pilus twitching motility protein PilT [Fischerella thermalis]|uniref:type IV pilus twitching motility protein PilT n=1 Tax=Fischerella thermalis TaxID=372787 RepID=UPI000300DB47|nr:PilT/PilU family type 4a pilus ATPase [Fischerella thermalis]PLZ14314.1 type IV pili twitching motility protein PilT [Fischerella thermalis WC119]PLZ66838.1 type IV pili twitching motility protein PilT [Fischerella thermalis WC246]PLZ73899.1 type IV pili twitching motility protein PilT [Fischerella thermalis WC245]
MTDEITSPMVNFKLSHLPLPPPPNKALLERIGQIHKNPISLEKIVRDAYKQKASDIHIRVGEIPRLRIRGEMVSYQSEEIVTPQIFEAYLSEILTQSQRQKFAETKELDTAIFYPGFLRCRVNCFETLTGGAIVLRLVTLEVPSIDSLGLPSILKEIIHKKQGLILVTGATGAGKSTTQAAMIRHLNETTRKHIITIEDPIEYIHSSKKSLISQREVGLHTQEFHQALRSALREDPDVILIGEMRDRITVDTAIKAAQTGHLVIGTLHTKNAIAAINRLVNVYNPDEQSAAKVQILDSLVAVIAQILLPTTDGNSTAAMEILINTPAMQDYLLKGEEIEALQLMENSTNEGMQIMNQALCKLMLSGQITIEDALSCSPDIGDLRRRARNDGINPSHSSRRNLGYSDFFPK